MHRRQEGVEEGIEAFGVVHEERMAGAFEDFYARPGNLPLHPLVRRTAFFFLSLACSIVLAPTAFAQGTEQAARRDSFITTSDGIKIHYLESVHDCSIPRRAQKITTEG